ncbi:cytochrome b [Falsiroseomonas oryziterrae]|uniref:cytochrome b n=1 Tax=Falsiroseomonas oryziterrae TaxID=2911368 RepID=UPI001F3248BD|nr:cytochrome b [Roseomonas sp. NPKOSM-4]
MTTTVALRSPGMATRAIHWATALLVLSAWVVGSTMEEFPRGAGRDLAMQLHYSLGILVLGFAALRVAWRLVAPLPPAQGPAWQRLGAAAMHLALIGLTIGVPLSGLLDRWARGRAVTVFGGFPLQAPFPVPGGRIWGETHEVLANLMLAAIAAHVLAALWHQFILRDRALSRMIRG